MGKPRPLHQNRPSHLHHHIASLDRALPNLNYAALMAGYPDKVTRLGFDPADWYLANNGAADVTVWDFSGKGPGGTSPRQLRGHDSVTDLAWQTAPAPKEACACGSRRPVSRDAVGVRGSGSISARLSLLSPGWTPIGSSA
ncbi:WD40 repeat protein [Catenulispora sp. MAP5-51]